LSEWDNYGIIKTPRKEALMPQIIPIKDLKDTAAVSELCHKMEEPVFVTKNGYGDMVLMSMELFEKTRRKWELYNDI
jgi:hypothetical protein